MEKEKLISFGKYVEGRGYKVLDEREIRASAGIMFLLGAFASINGFILKQYDVIPYISGFLVLNFIIGVFVNPKFSPTMFIAKLITNKQKALYVGAVQKVGVNINYQVIPQHKLKKLVK